MHGKEFVLDCFRTFFIVVTLINLAMGVVGLCLMPENRFGYEAFFVPLIYGAAGTLPNVVMYSKRELTVGALVVRKIIQFALVEVCVLFVAFYETGEEWLKAENVGSVATIVFAIYVISSLFDWFQNSLSAKHMTEELLKFQQSVLE